MILRRPECDHIAAIGQCEKAGFFSGHKFFNDNGRASITKTATEHIFNRGFRVGAGFRDNHAFARSKAVCFNDIRCLKCVEAR